MGSLSQYRSAIPLQQLTLRAKGTEELIPLYAKLDGDKPEFLSSYWANQF